MVRGISAFAAKLKRLRELNYMEADYAEVFYHDDAVPKLLLEVGEFLRDQGKPYDACRILQITRELPFSSMWCIPASELIGEIGISSTQYKSASIDEALDNFIKTYQQWTPPVIRLTSHCLTIMLGVIMVAGAILIALVNGNSINMGLGYMGAFILWTSISVPMIRFFYHQITWPPSLSFGLSLFTYGLMCVMIAVSIVFLNIVGTR